MAKATESYDIEDMIAMVLVAVLIAINVVIWRLAFSQNS